MQIVIEIPDDKLTQTQSVLDISLDIISGKVFLADGYNFCILPKGHGRLIDVDALNRKDVNCANVPMNFIDTAQTIIEADRRNEGYANEWIGYSRK